MLINQISIDIVQEQILFTSCLISYLPILYNKILYNKRLTCKSTEWKNVRSLTPACRPCSPGGEQETGVEWWSTWAVPGHGPHPYWSPHTERATCRGRQGLWVSRNSQLCGPSPDQQAPIAQWQTGNQEWVVVGGGADWWQLWKMALIAGTTTLHEFHAPDL